MFVQHFDSGKWKIPQDLIPVSGSSQGFAFIKGAGLDDGTHPELWASGGS